MNLDQSYQLKVEISFLFNWTPMWRINILVFHLSLSHYSLCSRFRRMKKTRMFACSVGDMKNNETTLNIYRFAVFRRKLLAVFLGTEKNVSSVYRSVDTVHYNNNNESWHWDYLRMRITFKGWIRELQMKVRNYFISNCHFPSQFSILLKLIISCPVIRNWFFRKY